MRYCLQLSYKGTHYHGWQKQPNGRSVQQTLEEALSRLLRSAIEVTGSGRTDTGVHASVQYAHFDVSEPVNVPESTWVHRLNRLLPPDIAVNELYHCRRPDFHARFDAQRRGYRYFIGGRKDPFGTEGRAFLPYYRELDFERMNDAARMLLELEDFASFCKLHGNNKTTICKLFSAGWQTESDYQAFFSISADRFLRGMVRGLVGTILETGTGKLTLEAFSRILYAKDRRAAKANAPACGLFLSEVVYGEGELIPVSVGASSSSSFF